MAEVFSIDATRDAVNMVKSSSEAKKWGVIVEENGVIKIGG